MREHDKEAKEQNLSEFGVSRINEQRVEEIFKQHGFNESEIKTIVDWVTVKCNIAESWAKYNH